MKRRRPIRTAALVAIAVLAVLTAASADGRKPVLNVYVAPGFDDVAWQKAALDKVLKAWKPGPVPAAGKKLVLISTVARDGSLLGARDNMVSGVPAWDQAAIEALKKAAPFPALPKTWPHPTLEIHWHFETK